MSLILQGAARPPAPRAHHSLMPHWLMQLGMPGLFLVAVVDSSPIPLPIPGSTDLLLLLLVAHGGDPVTMAAIAVTGSVVGGYTAWRAGKKGGETALQRFVPAYLLGRIVVWVERHPILTVFLPAVLPPPIPLSPFVLASGALGVSRNRFLAVFCAARCVRYSLIVWLAAVYGRRVVRLWSGTLAKWSTPLLWVFAGVMACSICIGIAKYRSFRKLNGMDEPEVEANATHGG
jgi:membrane protein YqaA with SNARE-associated domain